MSMNNPLKYLGRLLPGARSGGRAQPASRHSAAGAGWRCLFVTGLLAWAGALRAAGIEVVDDRGVTVRWDAPPEGIVALRPDAVLLAQSSRVIDRLEGLGLKVVALEPKSHADVQRVLGKVGQEI